jgi:MFS family permease
MALLFRLIPPHIYISITVLSWGLVASAQSLTTRFWQLLILRMLLGISEAAFCGVPFYLSFFYRREELASRVGVFISAAPLATTFASSLAWLITFLGSKSPIAPWRLLFLVEGFPSVLIAVWVWSALPDGPETAWFLGRREREIAMLRLQSDKDAESESQTLDDKMPSSKKTVQFREVLQTLMDPKSYLTAVRLTSSRPLSPPTDSPQAMFFSCNVAFSSMPVFLPTIIHQLGFTSLASQALSAPPYLLSFIVVILAARRSDKHHNRSSHIIFYAYLAASGYLLSFLAALFSLHSIIRYIAVYPACVGFFTCVTLIITWTINNQDSDSKKGTGVAMLQFLGQCGPLLGTRLYPEREGPDYLKGNFVCAAFMILVGILAWALRVVLRRQNEKRKRKWFDGGGREEGEAFITGGARPRKREIFLFML